MPKPVVYLETDPARRRALQEQLTALLPEWFGKASANVQYAALAELQDGYVAEIEGVPRGLLSLEWASPISAEIYWMGVDPAFHRAGLGRALVEAAAREAARRGVKYLFVATLHPDVAYEPYQRTRRFYEALGFSYVLEEQFPADPGNPLAYYLMPL
jgi:GNAT superfamily N-acetyltransferase